MAVITISRQLGSLGCEITQAVSRKMGYRVLRREVIHSAARRVGSPEIGLEVVDELGLLGISSSAKERKAYLEALKGVMLEEAALGDVIVLGRAGQVLLQEFPQSLHVRIIAPFALRVDRIMQINHISNEAAKSQIEASDHSRERFLHRFFNVRIEDPQLYDLVINTGRLSVDQSVELIILAAQKV